MATVERFDGQGRDRAFVQATGVDVDAVGVAAWDVETLDTADAAETVLGHAGVERVLGQVIGATDQAETGGRHDQVPEPAHPAQRTIAVLYGECCRCVDFEHDAAAMTAAAVRHPFRLDCSQ